MVIFGIFIVLGCIGDRIHPILSKRPFLSSKSDKPKPNSGHDGFEHVIHTLRKNGLLNFFPAFPLRMHHQFFIEAMNIHSQEQTLTTHIIVFRTWKDARIAWNSLGTSNLEYVNLYTNTTSWVPKFKISNLEHPIDPQSKGIKVYYNGTIVHRLDMQITTICEMNVVVFPFDIQACEIKFIYEGFTADELIITGILRQVIPTEAANAYWDILSISCDFRRKKSNFVEFRFGTWMRRNPKPVVVMFVFQAILFCVIFLFAAFITPSSGEKVQFAISILINYNVFSSNLIEMMPVTHSFPLLTYLHSVLVLLSFMSVFFTIIVNRLFHQSYNTGDSVPKVVMKMANRFRFLLCMKKTVSKKRLRPSVYEPHNFLFKMGANEKIKELNAQLNMAKFNIQSNEDPDKDVTATPLIQVTDSRHISHRRLFKNASVQTRKNEVQFQRKKMPSCVGTKKSNEDTETDTLDFSSITASLSTNNNNSAVYNRKELLTTAVLRQAILETELVRLSEWVFVSDVVDRILFSVLIILFAITGGIFLWYFKPGSAAFAGNYKKVVPCITS